MVEPIPPKQPPVRLEPAGEGASQGPSGSMQESSVGIKTSGSSSGDECAVGLSREQLENSAGPKDSALDVHGEGQDIKVGLVLMAQTRTAFYVQSERSTWLCVY